jgi:hypothetical protein
MVLVDPEWKFQLSSGDPYSTVGAEDPEDINKFFQEAKVEEPHVEALRSRFDMFSMNDLEGSDKPYLTLSAFHDFNARYDICSASAEEHFFRAMDRSQQSRICFEDFLLGAVAASPSTPHVLNSYTGYVRARYIFDFFNASRSGTLDYEEFARLLAVSRSHLGEGKETLDSYVQEAVFDLGEVKVVTLRLSCVSGVHIVDIRASTRWTGLQVRLEMERRAEMLADSHHFFFGNRSEPLAENACLDAILPEGTSSADVIVVDCGVPRQVPGIAEEHMMRAALEHPRPSGVERFVHVTFERFYDALVSERFRGTSRLFRFHRSVLHTKSKVRDQAVSSAICPCPAKAGAGIRASRVAASGGA